MGAELKFKLFGQNCNYPQNVDDITITAQWLNQNQNWAIDQTNYIFNLEEARKIIAQANTNIFQGVPLSIDIKDRGQTQNIMECLIDLTNNTEVIGKDEISCSVIKKEDKDWLEEVADGVSFGYIASLGQITASDYRGVKYILNYKPDAVVLLSLGVSIFMMSKEIAESIKRLANDIAWLANSLTPNVGLGVTLDAGDVLQVIARVIFNIAYTIAITTAVIKMARTIFEEIFPPERTHLGMSYYTMFQKACHHFGLTFQSSIFDSQTQKLVYLPIKDQPGDTSGQTGLPSANDPLYNVGDFIRVMKTRFNADYKIINGVFIFERVDYWRTRGNFTMDETANNTDYGEMNVEYNADELVKNLQLTYKYDTLDQNTLDNFKSAGVTVVTEIDPPLADKSQDMTKGLTTIELPFSYGVRKNGLDRIENTLKVLGGLVDKITFGGTSFKQQIQRRVGSMNMTSELVAVPKELFLTQQGKMETNQTIMVSGKALWHKYYYVSSFANYSGINNQFKRKLGLTIPFCYKDFLALTDNNWFITKQGKQAMVEKIEWNPNHDEAVIDIRINEEYAKNLNVKIIG